MEMTVRAARSDDAEFLAWVLLFAHRSHLSRGFWDLLIGGPEQGCLHFLELLAKTQQPHWAHYSTFLVAEVDGQPAAALSGYFEADLGRIAMNEVLPTVYAALDFSFAAYAEGMQRAGTIVHCSPEHEQGTWIIENVATRPEFRGQGLGNELLVAMLEIGRRRKAPRAGTGILIGNQTALSAYEKVGFKLLEEKRHPDFEAVYGCPGIRGLTMEL